jgi:hypothetical protein
MGRQSRQARRAHERRVQQRRRREPQKLSITFNWQVLAGLVIVLGFAAILGFKALGVGASSPSATTSTIPPGPKIAGVSCDQGMPAGGYHVHAHLSVYDKGKAQVIGQDSGHYYAKDCLFWLHAHDNIGIIHIEGPQVIHPALSTWLAVLNLTNPTGAPNITPGPGQTRMVWVNGKVYIGNPEDIRLHPHDNIQIDVGPPFPPYQRFNFAAHGY